MKVAFILLALLGFMFPLEAASHYIRTGASGTSDGSSWANAWPTFAAAQWTRGDTNFVADGTYNEIVVISKALNGSLWVNVKHANTNDNASDIGWSGVYSATQALVIGDVTLLVGLIEWDGALGSGESGHGFKIWNTNIAHTTCFAFDVPNTTNGYHVLHTEIRGCGALTNTTQDGFYMNNVSATTKHGMHIAYCWIHEASRNGITMSGVAGGSLSDYGLLFENNVLSETGLNTDGNHGQGMQMGSFSEDGFNIIRNNKFRNCSGTAMIAWLGGTGSNHHDDQIYNNTFSVTNNNLFQTTSPGVIYGHNAALSCSNFFIANNTFCNISNPVFGGYAQIALDSPGTNNVLYNNIWEGCYFSATHRGFATQSNNGYFLNGGAGVPSGTINQTNGTATALSSRDTQDYSLKTNTYAIGKGLNLSAYFTTDANGVTRSTWDLGAFAFVGAAPIIGIIPSSLSFGSILTNTTLNMTFQVTNSGNATLSGVATVPSPFSIQSGGSYIVSPGAAQTVTVQYAPTVAGSDSQTVTCTGGAGATVPVSGNATNLLVLVLRSLLQGNVTIKGTVAQ